jgi:large subunit ribosomal protein L17
MRHRVKVRKLGRTASHRRATLSALSASLIEHKRIRTTLAKAKATQRTIEPLITRAKSAHIKEAGGEKKDVHARRMIARFINKPLIVRELFDEIAPKVAERNGGYTRVVKLGQRDGDGAQLAVIELVDYNEAVTKRSKSKKKSPKPAATTKKEKSEADKQLAAEEETRSAEAPAPDDTESPSETESSQQDTGADPGVKKETTPDKPKKKKT